MAILVLQNSFAHFQVSQLSRTLKMLRGAPPDRVGSVTCPQGRPQATGGSPLAFGICPTIYIAKQRHSFIITINRQRLQNIFKKKCYRNVKQKIKKQRAIKRAIKGT